MDEAMERKMAATASEEEEDDTASVEDVMSTQESAKEDEDDDVDVDDDDMEEEEMEMTEEEDDEDLEMTEEELLDDDAKVAPSAVKAKKAGGMTSGAVGKRVKKKVRISDVSTVHGGGASRYNDEEDEEEDDDERESTAEEDDEEEDEDDFEEEEDRKRKQDVEAQALHKIELSDSASMLRMVQSLPEQEARRHEQFRRSHFERGAIKRVRLLLYVDRWGACVLTRYCSAWQR